MDELAETGVLPDRVAAVTAALALGGGIAVAEWLEFGVVGTVLLVILLLAAFGRAAASVVRN